MFSFDPDYILSRTYLFEIFGVSNIIMTVYLIYLFNHKIFQVTLSQNTSISIQKTVNNAVKQKSHSKIDASRTTSKSIYYEESGHIYYTDDQCSDLTNETIDSNGYNVYTLKLQKQQIESSMNRSDSYLAVESHNKQIDALISTLKEQNSKQIDLNSRQLLLISTSIKLSLLCSLALIARAVTSGIDTYISVKLSNTRPSDDDYDIDYHQVRNNLKQTVIILYYISNICLFMELLCVYLTFSFANDYYIRYCKRGHKCCKSICHRIAKQKIKKQNIKTIKAYRMITQ